MRPLNFYLPYAPTEYEKIASFDLQSRIWKDV